MAPRLMMGAHGSNIPKMWKRILGNSLANWLFQFYGDFTIFALSGEVVPFCP